MIHTKQVIKKIGFAGTLCASSVVGIVVAAEPGQTQVGANCPQIFYREPFTYQVAAPAGCPPTEFQRQNPGVGGSYPPGTYAPNTTNPNTTNPNLPPTTGNPQVPGASTGYPNPNLPPSAGNPEYPNAQTSYPNPNLPSGSGTTGPVPPLPEERSQAIGNIALVDNQIDVMMTNDTGVPVTYQLVGHTQPRTLAANQTVSIQNLPVPATITAVRNDEGLLNFEVTGSSQGMTEVSLTQEAELDDTQGVMRIQADGQIFAN